MHASIATGIHHLTVRITAEQRNYAHYSLISKFSAPPFTQNKVWNPCHGMKLFSQGSHQPAMMVYKDLFPEACYSCCLILCLKYPFGIVWFRNRLILLASKRATSKAVVSSSNSLGPMACISFIESYL